MKVVILPEVEDYLKDLGRILYEYEYFGFEDDAIEYIEDLILDIKKSLPIRQHKPAPEYFKDFVDLELAEYLEYAVFKKNRRTSQHTRRKKPERIFSLFDTLQTTTRWHNIYCFRFS